jgi:cephalosporin hydroxylase
MKMDPIKQFEKERAESIKEMGADKELRKKSIDWMLHADKYKYTYNYSWMGRPIIKYPNDLMILQEIIWNLKPDYIIETGIAHGGSIIFSASMLELIGHGEVIAVDIDIRKHNRDEIEKHPMFKRITMIEGSSVDPEIVNSIKEKVKGKKVLVCLDSLHTHAHVLKELEMYSEMVNVGSYIVCPDTFIEYFPKGYFSDRPWDIGDNPMTALIEFLKHNKNFIIDKDIDDKLLITEGFDGYLKRVK